MDLETFSSPAINENSHRTEQAIALIYAQLADESQILVQGDLARCGPEIVHQLRESASPFCPPNEAHKFLENLENISEEVVKSTARMGNPVPDHMRRLYTDCRLLHSLLDLRDYNACDDENMWLHAIRRVDMAIIVSGAPGESRIELILDTIATIQSQHLPFGNISSISDFENLGNSSVISSTDASNLLADNSIPRIVPPSLSSFFNKYSSMPFILPGYISDWPALHEHPWRSSRYLQQIAGRGRVVPVEVGSDYRTEDWNQKLMLWDEFLREIGMEFDNPVGNEQGRQRDGVLYLAQHNLMTQFPALRSDIVVPDYVYASLPPPSTFPKYLPPGNEEQLVINAWLGPKGTVSPAHTDPYFNCYAQVVGRKTVWLAPPHLQEEMYPFADPHAPHSARDDPRKDSGENPDKQSAEPSLANTSRVDVFNPSDEAFPLFKRYARPCAVSAVLEPGDMLYVPAGWWHAMRSEDISFSVSMWF